ncbi:nuclear receptor 2C2-associated protein-like isoform X1 [Crassostrea virginica]|uniref:Nuclear receptor 2C2-associated protein n=1 Tax=Crassostrea virginica TaxID=6565 RepID=A0A8B8DTM7_CRAVI|nr:nuclear receptor 2C2-associated protein-like [Crassostrea virginica]
MTTCLTNKKTGLRVSSVLRRAVKEFGPKHLVDDEEDTCWNSDQGSPQWIEVDLDSVSNVEEIQIRFQGGFAGKDCCIQMTDVENVQHLIMEFYPEDVNSLQSFKLPKVTSLKKFKIIFNNSTDFFGRITIYELKIIGDPM